VTCVVVVAPLSDLGQAGLSGAVVGFSGAVRRVLLVVAAVADRRGAGRSTV